MRTSKSVGTVAFKGIDQVGADASVQAWLCRAFVDVDLALGASET